MLWLFPVNTFAENVVADAPLSRMSTRPETLQYYRPIQPGRCNLPCCAMSMRNTSRQPAESPTVAGQRLPRDPWSELGVAPNALDLASAASSGVSIVADSCCAHGCFVHLTEVRA